MSIFIFCSKLCSSNTYVHKVYNLLALRGSERAPELAALSFKTRVKQELKLDSQVRMRCVRIPTCSGYKAKGLVTGYWLTVEICLLYRRLHDLLLLPFLINSVPISFLALKFISYCIMCVCMAIHATPSKHLHSSRSERDISADLECSL